MLRALAKGAVQFAFGNVPGGPDAYRQLTRRQLGTGASHVHKLQRVWPEYVGLWSKVGGIEIEGARLWCHDASLTPFPALAAYAITGSAGVATDSHDRMCNRYLARAVNSVASTEFTGTPQERARQRTLEPLRWEHNVVQLAERLGGEVHHGVDIRSVPVPNDAVDICWSGGALEHYRPEALDALLGEMYRALVPGGLCSHILDHRDHLYHVDKTIPFLAHLRHSDAWYERCFGHPLAYHNRLSSAEIAERFQRAGFERVAILRLTLPSGGFTEDDNEVLRATPGLPRHQLAKRFRSISTLDLCTAAAHYLYRKPAAASR